MNVLTFGVQAAVYLYLVYYLIEKTAVGPPVKMAVAYVAVRLWRSVKNKPTTRVPAKFREEMDLLERNYENSRKIKEKRREHA